MNSLESFFETLTFKIIEFGLRLKILGEFVRSGSLGGVSRIIYVIEAF